MKRMTTSEKAKRASPKKSLNGSVLNTEANENNGPAGEEVRKSYNGTSGKEFRQ